MATAVSFSLVSTPIAAAVDGTVTIDNENRPPDTFCEANTEDNVAWNDDTPQSCTQPKQLQRQLSSYARDAVSGLAIPAFLAVLGAWFLTTAWLFAIGDGEGSLTALLGDTAWAAVPFLLPAVARPLLLREMTSTYAYGGGIESVEATATTVATGAVSSTLFFHVGRCAPLEWTRLL